MKDGRCRVFCTGKWWSVEQYLDGKWVGVYDCSLITHQDSRANAISFAEIESEKMLGAPVVEIVE